MLILIFGNIVFYVLQMIGNDVSSQNAGSLIGNEEIVFNTDAAEVTVFLYDIKIEEGGTVVLLTPIVYQGWNKIDARFICDHESFLKSSAQMFLSCRP